MPRRVPLLPELVGRPFSVSQARALGISYDRLDSEDLARPFHGARSQVDPVSIEDRCRAYSTRMRDGNVFGYVTAADLWDIPLPAAMSTEILHVVSPRPRRAPQGRGIVGHRSYLADSDVGIRRGLSITSASRTWCDLAEVLGVDDLIAAGEWLITGNPYGKVLPVSTIDDLRERASARQGMVGQPTRIAALARMREGALSRPETLLRLLLERSGIPRALINADVFDVRGRFLGMPDLIWPEYRVAVEYEGRHHAGTVQFRRDIRRIEHMVDAEWLVVKISATDLFVHPAEAVARVASRLRSRGWRGHLALRQIGSYAP